jgi:hypothetical protein
VSTCPQCSAPFEPATPRQRWCTPKCQVQAANQRRASTRDGRKAGAVKPTAPKAVTEATIANLFGQWFVRVNGWLALGPMAQALAQDHADRINNHGI